MFTNSISQSRYSRSQVMNGINTRVNPFMNEDLPDSISMPIDSLTNSLLVTDHFDKPLIYLNASVEELTKAVKECKKKILESMDKEDDKNRYISQLIELNKRLHTLQEEEKYKSVPRRDTVVDDSVIIERPSTKPLELIGHQLFRFRSGIGKKIICETCKMSILAGRSVYNCSYCLVYVHYDRECLGRLSRACPASNIGHPSLFPSQIISGRKYSSAGDNLCIDIETVPLTGNLLKQNFLCAECNYPIAPITNTNYHEPQRSPSLFCHYYCKYYCTSCHWGNCYWIPSMYFMLNKWTKLPVCRSAYLKLKYAWSYVLFRIPSYWQQHHSNASEILNIRLKLFRLRAFVNQCSQLKKLTNPYSDWLIDQPFLVNMQLVQNISNGSAATALQLLYSIIIDHISDCEICRGFCNPCSLCDASAEILLPTPGSVTWACSKCCFSIVHKDCGLKKYLTESDFICLKCSPR